MTGKIHKNLRDLRLMSASGYADAVIHPVDKKCGLSYKNSMIDICDMSVLLLFFSSLFWIVNLMYANINPPPPETTASFTGL
jgi:hypothetical protein